MRRRSVIPSGANSATAYGSTRLLVKCSKGKDLGVPYLALAHTISCWDLVPKTIWGGILHSSESRQFFNFHSASTTTTALYKRTAHASRALIEHQLLLLRPPNFHPTTPTDLPGTPTRLKCR